MMSNFGEMVAQLVVDLKYGPDAGDDVRTRLRRYLNDAQQELLRMSGLAEQRELTLPFKTDTEQATYGIPAVFDRIQRISEPGGSRRLQMRTTDWLLNMEPQWQPWSTINGAIGTPEVWVPLGMDAVYRQPWEWVGPEISTALSFRSTSPLDGAAGTPITVRVVAVRAGGSYARLSAAVNGITEVGLGAGAFRAVTSLTTDRAATGTISLYIDGEPSKLLSQIQPGETAAQYYRIRLWPTPNGSLDYIVAGTMRIPLMIFDTDIPRVQPEYADALLTYARMREYKTVLGDTDRFMIEDAEWKRVVAELKGFSQFPPDYRPVAGGPGDRSRWSNLGGYFPPDGWGWNG